MRILSTTVTVGLGASIFATLLAPSASAGYGNTSVRPAASLREPSSYRMQSACPPARFVLVGDHHSASGLEPIVGMCKVASISQHNQGIPDGTVIDAGYSQWHSDGIVDHRGNNHTGTFTIDILDARGDRIAHISAQITGERITAD